MRTWIQVICVVEVIVTYEIDYNNEIPQDVFK
jgi:hypothetical protein